MVQDSKPGYICIFLVIGNKNTYKISFTEKEDPQERFKQVRQECQDIQMKEFDYVYVSNLKEAKNDWKSKLSNFEYNGYRKYDYFYRFPKDTDNESFINFIDNYKSLQKPSQTYPYSGSSDLDGCGTIFVGLMIFFLFIVLPIFIFNPKYRECITHGGGGSCSKYLNLNQKGKTSTQ